MKSHWAYKLHFRADPLPCSRRPTQSKLSAFGDLLIYLFIYHLIVLCLVTSPLILVFAFILLFPHVSFCNLSLSLSVCESVCLCLYAFLVRFLFFFLACSLFCLFSSILVLVCFILLFLYSCLFSNEREREKKRVWIWLGREVGSIREELGEGKSWSEQFVGEEKKSIFNLKK